MRKKDSVIFFSLVMSINISFNCQVSFQLGQKMYIKKNAPLFLLR